MYQFPDLLLIHGPDVVELLLICCLEMSEKEGQIMVIPSFIPQNTEKVLLIETQNDKRWRRIFFSPRLFLKFSKLLSNSLVIICQSLVVFPIKKPMNRHLAFLNLSLNYTFLQTTDKLFNNFTYIAFLAWLISVLSY